jgi:hypothetical protein
VSRPGFLAPIATERALAFDRADRPIWELTRPLLYLSPGLRQWLLVPPRFRTNYASVPRLPFVYWWCADRCWEEPALHDLLYTVHGIWLVDFEPETAEWSEPIFKPVEREMADDLFLESLRLNPRTDGVMATAMHRAVRLGGQSSWDDDTLILQAEDFRQKVALG